LASVAQFSCLEISVLSHRVRPAEPRRARSCAAVVLVAAVATTACGPFSFLHRRSDGVINVHGAVAGLPSGSSCDLKLLSTNGKTIESLRIAAVFDRSVVVAPAGARRRFEISCEGHPGTFRSRPYKSHDWTQVDLGMIVLTSQGQTTLSRR